MSICPLTDVVRVCLLLEGLVHLVGTALSVRTYIYGTCALLLLSVSSLLAHPTTLHAATPSKQKTKQIEHSLDALSYFQFISL